MHSRLTGPILLCALLAPSAALAAPRGTPITSTLDLRFGTWTPSIDDESAFEGQVGPYKQAFDGESMFYFEGIYGRELYRGFGSAGFTLGAGYGGVSGDAIAVDGGPSPDGTSLRMIPLRVGGFYRFDVLQERFGVPFVLQLDAGLVDAIWWVSSDAGISDAVVDGKRVIGDGDTRGYYAGASIYLLLDALAPRMAVTFDANSGVNNSYLFATWTLNRVDDFGSSTSWDLSDETLLFGLGFEM
jgi:hypothetical protein